MQICDDNPAGDVAHSGAKCVTSCFVFHAAHHPDVWLSFVRRSQRLIFDTKNDSNYWWHHKLQTLDYELAQEADDENEWKATDGVLGRR